MPSKKRKYAEDKILENDTTKKCRLLRKNSSDASVPDSKKKSIQMSIAKHTKGSSFNKTKNEFLVSPKSNASLSLETKTQLGCLKCPKCFYKCKSSITYKKHSCNNTLACMKSCVVVLNIFPGLDINTRGNMLFFQCRQCSKFFMDGYSYSQHLLTHSEGRYNRSIKTISLNINRSFPIDDKTLLDADANFISNANKVPFLNPDESTSKALPDKNNLASNSPKKCLFYRIPNLKSDAGLSSETESKLTYKNCPKCFYKCKSTIKYQKHSCDKTLAYMKSCAVVLSIFPGLDLNTKGNTLFFQCHQCSRFFMDGYSYSKHLSTHPKEEFNRRIKTVSLDINSFYQTPTIGDDVEMCLDEDNTEMCLEEDNVEMCLEEDNAEMCLEEDNVDMCLEEDNAEVCLEEDNVDMCLEEDNAEVCLEEDNVDMCLDEDNVEMCLYDEEKINSNGSNVISVSTNDITSASPDSRNLVSNVQEKSRSFCCIS